MEYYPLIIFAFPYLLIFAAAPSIIWLLLFLRQDVHPEPKRIVLKVFFLGVVLTFLLVLFYIFTSQELNKWVEWVERRFSPFLAIIFHWFILVALLEEIVKYLAVKIGVLKHAELDEPIDIMLYMIIAGLGFAFLENLLLFGGEKMFLEPFGAALIGASGRLISATFLHALCSGIFGFFIALGFFETKKRTIFWLSGLISATLLHGLYNFAIMELRGFWQIGIPALIIIALAFFVWLGFIKLRKLKSVCKID